MAVVRARKCMDRKRRIYNEETECYEFVKFVKIGASRLSQVRFPELRAAVPVRQITYGRNFVQSIIEEGNDIRSISEKDEQRWKKVEGSLVHMKVMKNASFVTVTDLKGKTLKGLRSSAGSLEGGSRLSRYAAEATAEHVGRAARKMGIKSVVIKIKGSMFFRKKKAVILGWKEGYTFGLRNNVRGNQTSILSIHDVTQLPHNGCRLPKKRRV
ncbi:hypothetical protein GIB67_042210 [Kingdonia uniflora]|uniref:Ribosomal protein S11 n=1 Tax=Kingdonia uniflora TaxID=39325 RepID=A0A7J7LDU0_9MAGN|nr:hypothetical protein GIB67_042210 [Kingdonia uniflora]